MVLPPMNSRHPSTTPPTTTTTTTNLIEKLCHKDDKECYRTTYFETIDHINLNLVLMVFGGAFLLLLFLGCFGYLCCKFIDRREQRNVDLMLNGLKSKSTAASSRDDKLNPLAGEIV